MKTRDNLSREVDRFIGDITYRGISSDTRRQVGSALNNRFFREMRMDGLYQLDDVTTTKVFWKSLENQPKPVYIGDRK